MGKKSKEPREDEEAVKSLFGTDNPKPTKKLRLGMDSSAAEKETIAEAKNLDVEHSNARKRKRDTLCPPSSDEESIPRKRMKLVQEAGVDGLKKKNKRKFGSVGEEEPADMLNTKESFDDNCKLLRTVFVGNLPLQTKRKALNRKFARFGDIESVRIRSVPLVDTKALMKGKINEEVESMNAYIVFKEEQSAHAALSNNMTQIGGKYIHVDMACPSHKNMNGDAQLSDRKRLVFVGNLPFDVKDEELYQLFSGLSQSEPNVEAVQVIRDPITSIGKGIAYVLFKTRYAANSVCKRRDLEIRDNKLRVCHAKLAAISSEVKEGTSNGSHHQWTSEASSFTASGKEEKKNGIDTDLVLYEGTDSS